MDKNQKEKVLPIPSTMEASLLAWSNNKPVCPKNGKAQYGKYSTLEDVIATVDQAAKHGLTFTQVNDFIITDQGAVVDFIQTEMIHASSGSVKIGRTPIKVKETSNPQAMGSGITYAKRYGLQAMFGLASDDDGKDAAGSAAATGNKTIKRVNPEEDF